MLGEMVRVCIGGCRDTIFVVKVSNVMTLKKIKVGSSLDYETLSLFYLIYSFFLAFQY